MVPGPSHRSQETPKKSCHRKSLGKKFYGQFCEEHLVLKSGELKNMYLSF